MVFLEIRKDRFFFIKLFSMRNWITPVLILIGAVLLFGASGIVEGGNSLALALKILGLIFIMGGIYRASKVVRSYSEKDHDHDTEG